jgi:predicted dithiol-disulfide oxidoreductase (DUF899 family)
MKGPLEKESEAYRRARAELLEAEIALRDQCERVAALRRKLPAETEVEDYIFEEGPAELEKDGPFTKVRLSGLFADVNKPLVVYQYMYGAAQKRPCPMCTLWVDGFNGVAHHLRQRVNFAVIAQVGIGELREWGRQRCWRQLRLVSSAGSNFKTDLHYQDADGKQDAGISVFVRSPDGSVKHFYSGAATVKEKVNRGIDLLSPVWNIFDLTPGGRGDWNAKLHYE